MEIRQIHHVQLAMPVGGEPEAIGFYDGLLGIPRVDKPANLAGRGGCWFENETIRLHLGVDHDFRPASKAHPALVVEGLAELERKLEAVGIAVEPDEQLPGFNRFYVNDPFGNRIEVLEPTG